MYDVAERVAHSRKGHGDVDGHHSRRDDLGAQLCKSKSEIRHIGINNLLEISFKNEINKLWYCR